MEETLLPNANDRYRKIQIGLDALVIILFFIFAAYIYFNWEWIQLLTKDICQSCMIKTKAFCYYNHTISEQLVNPKIIIP